MQLTTGWIAVNLVLSAGVTAVVAGVSVLMPLWLDRRAAPEVWLPAVGLRGTE